jgi:protein tyrosine kinase modulator
VPEAHRSPSAVSGARDLTPAPLPRRSDDGFEDEIDFTRYFRVFAQHWILLVVLALVGGLTGFVVSRLKPVLYEGVTTILISPPAKVDVRTASIANFRALLENLTHASQVINELALDKPPFSLTAQRFHDEAMQIEEIPGTNLVKVRVRLSDPQRAMEASKRLSQKAVSLNTEISRREGSSIRDLLQAHLNDASDQLKAAETQLLAYQREAQVELLERDTDAMIYERGELLRLTIDIESEKARLSAAESEITKQQRVLSVPRSVPSEDALRRAAELDRENPAAAAIKDAQTLDLSNPFINPVYQTLALQIASSRARLAGLQQQRRELIEVKKLGGRELKELSELYSRQIHLARLQTNYDLAKKVYGDIRLRYEETRSDGVGSSAVLQVVDAAIPPDRPLSRQTGKSTALGFVAGFMVAALAALALDSRATNAARKSR